MSKRFIHKGARTEYMIHNQGGRHTRDQASGEEGSWRETNRPRNHVYISMGYICQQSSNANNGEMLSGLEPAQTARVWVDV